MKEETLKFQTKKGVYWTFFNQFANNGISFVVGIILARLLSPSDYGIAALPAVFIAVANLFINGGFTSALVRKPEVNDGDLSTSFYYSILVGIVCYCILFFTSPLIADFYNEPILKSLVRVTALTFLWSPLQTPQNVLMQRRLDFKTPARIAIITSIIGGGVSIFMAYSGYGLWAIVISGVVGSFCATLLTWLAVRWWPKTAWSKESFSYLWGYGNKLLASGLIDTVYNNITPIIIGKFYSPAQLGIYNRAYNYAALPAQQGTGIIQKVTFPVLSKMQDDDESLAKNYRRILKLSAFVIFPVMTMLSALAKPLVIVLVTEKWIESVIFLQIICFSMMWWPIHSINLNLLQVKGRSDLFLRLEVVKKILGLTIMGATLPFGLIYFVSAGILSSLICLFINTYYTGKLINVGFLTQMKDLLPTTALSLLIFVIVLAVNHFIPNLWLQLIVGGIIGVSVYLGIAYLFKFDELKDVRYMLEMRR